MQQRVKHNNTNERINLLKAISRVSDIFEYSISNRAAFKKSQSFLRKIDNRDNRQINDVFEDFRLQVRHGSQSKDSFDRKFDGYGIIEIYRMNDHIDVYVFDSAFGKFLDWDQVRVNKYCANNLRFLHRVLNQLPT